MTRLEDQFPLAGRECKFFLKDGNNFIGFFDHGGAYDPSNIISEAGSNYYFEQKATGANSYDLVLGWEYTH